MPVLSISYPLRHEQRSGPVHTPLMQPLINQIKFLNRNCHNKMECGTKEQLVNGNAYFSQIGEQIEFCRMYPGRHSHRSGATHSP